MQYEITFHANKYQVAMIPFHSISSTVQITLQFLMPNSYTLMFLQSPLTRASRDFFK